jgi:hypothetical protein
MAWDVFLKNKCPGLDALEVAVSKGYTVEEEAYELYAKDKAGVWKEDFIGQGVLDAIQ